MRVEKLFQLNRALRQRECKRQLDFVEFVELFLGEFERRFSL
jgi:hypothetical protein